LSPPIPKALTPARRGSDPLAVKGRGAVITSEETSFQGMLLLGVLKLPVGGRVPDSSAMIALIIAAAPAVSRVWPMLPFTDPIGSGRPSCLRAAPKTSSSAPISVASPIGVEVAWASSRPIVRGSRPDPS
jgi:hypothetical protein